MWENGINTAFPKTCFKARLALGQIRRLVKNTSYLVGFGLSGVLGFMPVDNLLIITYDMGEG